MRKLLPILCLFIVVCFLSCTSEDKQVAENIKTYSNTWDEVINNGKLELINNTHFDERITLLMSPENIVGIKNVQDFYANYLTGFSNIEFTIVDIFGQGDKIVKHWNFKGTHTGEFFGISATGKSVDIDGVTLVSMKNGKVSQEQDFMDNMAFMQQLGILSNPDNIRVINTLYDAFAAGDIPAVLDLMDAKVVWHEAEGNAYADGNPYKGPEAVSNGVFARIGKDYDYFNLTNIQLHEMSGNQILATLRYQAKSKKNGTVIDAQVAHHWFLKNGKIIGFQQYVETKQLAEALSK
ncbi:ester cyclase [Maribacter sp. ANRC-HE7]|uniref:Ester cyclase n=1 Tax=Maribacter aquimaris TaxID=2737171 RepID=A0ABR7UWA7_9FLAO|nr:ester cyclase [Maribacter aquimaris]MBD0776698.1 ester cyclase [Maribacter aquimaris]